MGEVIGIANRGTLFLYYFGGGLLAIPFWLFRHIIGTRIGHELFGVDDNVDVFRKRWRGGLNGVEERGTSGSDQDIHHRPTCCTHILQDLDSLNGIFFKISQPIGFIPETIGIIR